MEFMIAAFGLRDCGCPRRNTQIDDELWAKELLTLNEEMAMEILEYAQDLKIYFFWRMGCMSSRIV